ncbi:FAD-dependent oxidoreductase [Cupriavidus sp. D39]|uniref:FAD-dependent oxidoreductase n=1 Tax=Cupriavidus sp. D39 TaxID=2997877 RepID=UPI002272170C|nr:FAD-dependent oxidoreductase [Cupriavidus sp. D39]MCY0853614.1 FAD-dependent oxidoreductase [Cupriavidus sp. D39]
MPTIKKALIVGAGIGGLTAAIALRRKGIEVEMVELNPEWSVYGVGIIQPNNMLRALDRIGLAQECVKVGAGFAGWRIHDKDGNHLMDARSTSAAAPLFPENNGITRPRLHKILSDSALATGATVTLGTTVDAIHEDEDGVHVTFPDGTSRNYDLVIGADGIYSRVRGMVFGEKYQPTFIGQAVWRYNLPRVSDVAWGELFFGPDSKVGLVPMSDREMYMLLVTAEPGNPWMEKELLADKMRQRLAEYTGLIANLRELITDPAGVVYKPMETILMPAPWNKGRVLLIGDAAHAATPHLAQGAAMAIEDAVLLGDLLANDTPLQDALSDFMRRRFSRARFVYESCNQISAWEQEEWRGEENPNAKPGELLHSAILELMNEY